MIPTLHQICMLCISCEIIFTTKLAYQSNMHLLSYGFCRSSVEVWLQPGSMQDCNQDVDWGCSLYRGATGKKSTSSLRWFFIKIVIIIFIHLILFGSWPGILGLLLFMIEISPLEFRFDFLYRVLYSCVFHTYFPLETFS